jgi:hypothetical protein
MVTGTRQDHGVWGGTTEEERKLMRRSQSRARRRLARATALPQAELVGGP